MILMWGKSSSLKGDWSTYGQDNEKVPICVLLEGVLKTNQADPVFMLLFTFEV